VINELYPISGSQSPEAFERALRDIGSEAQGVTIKAER
jgi:predicted DsbA family dithiol-disulfide isomerase